MLLPTLVVISAFFSAVAWVVFRAQLSKPKTGATGLVGEIGFVKQALNPHGKVFVHGELWNAVSRTPLSTDARVRVVKVTGLTLEVEPAPPDKVRA